MFLATTSSVLRLVTNSTADLHVTCNWVETASGGQTPGQQRTAINTATTTTILSSPAASTVRRAIGLYVINVHASASNTVTLQVYDGTTAYDLYEVVLSPGWLLFIGEDGRPAVFDNSGRALGNDSLGNQPAAVNALNLVVLPSDVTNNNATANTIADITGLSFSVVSGQTFYFRFLIDFTSAAGTTGVRFTINGPAFTRLSYASRYPLSTTSETPNHGLAAYDSPASCNATVATTGANLATVEGYITPSASGTLIARFASEISSSAVVAKAGSMCQWVRTL